MLLDLIVISLIMAEGVFAKSHFPCRYRGCTGAPCPAAAVSTTAASRPCRPPLSLLPQVDVEAFPPCCSPPSPTCLSLSLLPPSSPPLGRTLARGCRARRRQLGAPGAEQRPPPGPPCRPLASPPTRACWEARQRANRALLLRVRPPLAASVPGRFRQLRPPQPLPSSPTRSW